MMGNSSTVEGFLVPSTLVPRGVRGQRLARYLGIARRYQLSCGE
jgi:hypothetical protein